MIRCSAFLAGGLVIAAVAHANVMAAGGFASPGAPLQVALALGLAVGAVAVGRAWATRRWALSALLALALVAGEGFVLIGTAERTIGARDASAAPLVAAAETRTRAEARVRAAEAALAAAPPTSPRLAAAIAAKAVAEARALEDAAKKTCAANCRALLEGTKAEAGREVDAARAEFDTLRAKAEAELAQARTAMAALPAPRSASPLADRLGVPAWLLDVLAAALASLAANGLGAGLLAFAAHGGPSGRIQRIGAAAPNERPATAMDIVTDIPRAQTGPEESGAHVARFAVEMLRSEPKGALPVKQIPALYREWATRSGVGLVAPDALASELKALISRAGLVIAAVDGEPTILGVALRVSIATERPTKVA